MTVTSEFVCIKACTRRCLNTVDGGDKHTRGLSSTRVVSWNVAGVATDELCLFFAETYAVLEWDILMLQEAFVKTEGIQSDCKHVIYTPEQNVTGLRTPAIVVNEKCHGKSRLLSCGIRWVAVESNMHHFTTIFVSVHLPHARAKLAADFQDTLQQISFFIQSLPGNARLCLGLDANTRMSGYTDGCVIGDAVPDDPDDDSERPQRLYEFLRAHRLWLLNTWLSGDDPQLWKTRFPLEYIRELSFGGGGKQIDFIALCMFQSVDDVKISRDLMFFSDHFPLTITCCNHNRKSQLSHTTHHRQQDHRYRKTRLLSSGTGSQMTIGTTPSVFLRYPARTGRRFPDFMRWLMSTQGPV